MLFKIWNNRHDGLLREKCESLFRIHDLVKVSGHLRVKMWPFGTTYPTTNISEVLTAQTIIFPTTLAVLFDTNRVSSLPSIVSLNFSGLDFKNFSSDFYAVLHQTHSFTSKQCSSRESFTQFCCGRPRATTSIMYYQSCQGTSRRRRLKLDGWYASETRITKSTFHQITELWPPWHDYLQWRRPKLGDFTDR